MGSLYLVATPIGNLEDITARALRILRQVRLVAAEDTRQTRLLLAHYGINTSLTSYHEHNKIAKLPALLKALDEGDVALVSDAGTPLLNDPGVELVRAALDAGHAVTPIPGPSAPLAALVASGLPVEAFLYLGYLPRKAAARRRSLAEVAGYPYTLVFLETPHRLRAALEDISAVLGDRQIAVARELTKLHEEIFRGPVSAAQERFSREAPRGEITLVVAGELPSADPWPESRLMAALEDALDRDEAPARIARQIAERSGWPRRQVYRRFMQLRDAPRSDSG